MEKLDLQLAQQWTKANRRLLQKHSGEWIAYNGEDGIIAHDKSAGKVIDTARSSGKQYIVKYLHPYAFSGPVRLLSIRFRAMRQDYWEPIRTVKIKTRDKEETLEMLVDSGAGISTVSLDIGEKLGFKVYDDERVLEAAGVGSRVRYVVREVEMELENHVFRAPVAWLLDENCNDLLLGREVVFDLFNIEFRQPDEEIIFTKRDAPAA